MKLLLRHRLYTCIYCVKIFSRWNIYQRGDLKLKAARISVLGPFKTHWSWPEMMQMNTGSKLNLALRSTYSLIQVTINGWDIKMQELPDYQILTCPHH